jgi:arylsulfatase A-like enzyme
MIRPTVKIVSIAAALAIVACAAPSGDGNGSKTDPNAPPVAGEPGAAAARSGAAVGRAGKAADEPGRQHAVFSLADNRLLAHAQRDGGLVVLGGSAGFAKYNRFGKPRSLWKLRRDIDGKKVALASQGATLGVPLTAAQAAATSIAFRAYSRSGTRLNVEVNGEVAGRGEIPAGWHTVSVDIEAGKLVAGENRIGFAFRGRPAAFEWVQIGGTHDDALVVPVVYDGHALVLPRGGGLAYYVRVPDGGRLIGEVVGDGCAVDVVATAHDGVAKGTLRGAGGRVDLSAVAGKVVRLDLTGSGCDSARLNGGALAMPGEAPAVKRADPPKYVVLWIMDTLRADKVKVFNPDARADVPNWERLAKRGVVFENAYVQGNESQASHASIWTSVYPILHKINISKEGPWQLDEELSKLGELMDAAGFYTTGVTANGFITVPARYGAGFDAFANPMRDGHGKRLNGKIPADMLWERVLASLDGKTADPFFLFLGTIDTHKPWVAREPWISRYDPEPYDGKYKDIVWGGDVGVKAGRMISTEKQTERDLQRLHAIYDCGVSYQDEYVGKLLDKLDEWGIADQTMIAITADHGEEMWEQGRVGHGATLRQSLVHVPLLISYPPLMPPGAIVEGVDGLDILPTFLDAIGAEIPDNVQGESLIPLAQGVGRGYPRPSISTQYGYHHVMQLGGWKLWARGKSDESERVRLYDLRSDYDERNDLSGERPIELRFLTDAMGTFLEHRADWNKRAWGVASNMTARAAKDLDGE